MLDGVAPGAHSLLAHHARAGDGARLREEALARRIAARNLLQLQEIGLPDEWLRFDDPTVSRRHALLVRQWSSGTCTSAASRTTMVLWTATRIVLDGPSRSTVASGVIDPDQATLQRSAWDRLSAASVVQDGSCERDPARLRHHRTRFDDPTGTFDWPEIPAARERRDEKDRRALPDLGRHVGRPRR